jgi:hypothetical protein
MSWLTKALKSVSKVALPLVGNALLPGVGGYLGGALAGAVGSGKPSLGNIATGAVTGGLVGGAGNALKAGGLKSVGSGALDFAKNNPELILGGLSAIQGSKQQAKANELQKQALALAQQPWNETAGLRAQSLESLLHPQKVDLSSVYTNTSNPFARPMRSVGG